MRVILAGSDAARANLRERVSPDTVIVGEFSTLAAARRAHVAADGVLVSLGAELTELNDEPYSEALTSRESDVIQQLAEGLTNKAIAERLQISDQTVKFHVASLMGKLGATNRTDAVRRAVQRGLITL